MTVKGTRTENYILYFILLYFIALQHVSANTTIFRETLNCIYSCTHTYKPRHHPLTIYFPEDGSVVGNKQEGKKTYL
jgi:hypothetical protein